MVRPAAVAPLLLGATCCRRWVIDGLSFSMAASVWQRPSGFMTREPEHCLSTF